MSSNANKKYNCCYVLFEIHRVRNIELVNGSPTVIIFFYLIWFKYSPILKYTFNGLVFSRVPGLYHEI